MSPKRAALPGKDALFGPAPAEAPAASPAPALEPAPAPPPPASVPAAAPGPVAPPVPEASRHVQLCVWIAPEVADEVDRARARLLMDHGIKVTKSEIVEAVLAPVLPDLETLRHLLGR